MVDSLLVIAQDAADQIGLARPSTVIGNTADEVAQIIRFANQEGIELAGRGPWQVLTKEQTFTTVAAEIQTSAIPSNFGRFIHETFWNRTRKRPLYGPVSAQEWQNLQAWSSNPMRDTFRQRGGDILITPTPTAGDTIAYEYVSKNWLTNDAGDTARSKWAADNDIPILDAELIKLGIVWRYRQSRGLPYEDDLAFYNAQVEDALREDGPRRTLSMASPSPYGGRRPGIVVPEGSWSL